MLLAIRKGWNLLLITTEKRVEATNDKIHVVLEIYHQTLKLAN